MEVAVPACCCFLLLLLLLQQHSDKAYSSSSRTGEVSAVACVLLPLGLLLRAPCVVGIV